MARYLVTGGCGFIGSHLTADLIARGHQVLVLDDFSTGRASNLAPGALLQRGDVTSADDVSRAVTAVDGCFHLAAIASVDRTNQDWIGTHRVNLGGMIEVLDAAHKAKVARGVPVPVVYASSAAVYGDNPALPLAEDSALRPLSAYGADKLGCELHARAGGAVHGIPTMGLRFFNVYGPRQDPASPYSGVISIFCNRLFRGETVTIHGDGQQTRDFIHVGDVVLSLIAAMAVAATDAPVLNVCSGKPTSIVELAEAIAGACEVPLRMASQPARRGDIKHSLGSNARLAQTLGARKTKSIQDGLADVVSWIRQGQPGLC